MTTNAGHDILEVMTLLEEGGGQLDSRKISLASSHKDSSVLRKLLLRSRDDIHMTNEFGRTPLHLACMYGGADGVDLLLKHGSELSLDKRGSTPFHYALKSCVDKKEKLKLLLNKNSTNDEDFVNLTDCMKCTALHYAAQLLDSDCVKMLVEAQADINALDVWKQSPLFYVSKEFIPAAAVDMYYGNTALHYSLLTKKVDCHKVVQALLEKKTDVKIKNKTVQTPLLCAAWGNCIECVKLLLPDSDVNAQDSDGNTVLHCCLLSDKFHCHEVIQALLAKEADLRIKIKNGHTPFHYAAWNQYIKCVELMISRADVNAQDVKGDTALHCSFSSDEPHCHEVIRALLKKGADVVIKNKKDQTPLHCAAWYQCVECLKLLLPLSDVNAQDSIGNTALRCSFLSNENHSHEVIHTLLDKEADVKFKNKKGETVLHCAAWNQCMECLELLLPLSDVNAQDSDGNTALHFSSLSDNSHCHEVIQALLEEAHVGIMNWEDKTPLHYAALNQCMECVELMLPVSDVNAQDSNGNTALHYSFLSAKPNSHEVIQSLLKKGSDVRIQNKKGLAPLHFAAWNQCMECLELLLPLSDVNAQDNDGNTALHFSSLSDEPHSHEVIHALLDKEADVKIKNKNCKTPLQCAAQSQCMECVELLLPLSDVHAEDSDGDSSI